MKALVFGSLNIDRVYSLEKLPEKGETLYCSNYELHVGGKGLNQALSLKKAGLDVYFAGKRGNDGAHLTDFLASNGVNTSLVKLSDGFTGHAVIEVDPDGQNQMILFPGANKEITPSDCDEILKNFGRGDLVLMQYETSCVEYMIRKAKDKGMLTALNPSPYTHQLKSLPYELIDYLILNEDEGKSISGKTDIVEALDVLCTLCPNGNIIYTLGAKGSIYANKNERTQAPAFKVKAVDTTGAGDTFTGYVLEKLIGGSTPAEALRFASAASALAVQKAGAAETIPCKDEVEKFLNCISE